MNTDGPLFIYLAKKVCIIFQLKTKNPYFCVPVMGAMGRASRTMIDSFLAQP